MPAEWEPHEGTWLQWPQDKVYRGYEMKLERIWLNMVDALHDHEKVHMIVNTESQRDHVADQLELSPYRFKKYRFLHHPHKRCLGAG